jgi:predicted HD phosphohydrolase
MSGYRSLDRTNAADWEAISAAHVHHYRLAGPYRIMDQLRLLRELALGFPCDQLQHALIAATLARSAGADDETVVVALCHDVGKTLSVPNHAAIGAELLKPYVSEQHYLAVLHHQDFQGRYYYHHFGAPNDLRDAYRGESWYGLAEKLVDQWDMPAFDPDFVVDPLESFEPAVVSIFSTPRFVR